MSIDVSLNFPHRFTCEVLHEFPGGKGVEHYYPPGQDAGQDGLVVRVRPASGDAWVGMFAFGKIERNGKSCVLSMADPERLCVVAGGAGYVVTAANPLEWEAVPAIPIVDVCPAPSAGLVVFANYTQLMAYSSDGLKWRTKRLAWDRLTIVAVDEKTLVGEYWEPREEEVRRFEVDLGTGTARGGVEL